MAWTRTEALALGPVASTRYKENGPASYSTGGFAADFVTLFAEINSVKSVQVSNNGGYSAFWDSAAKKVKVMEANPSTGAPAEVAAAANLSTVEFVASVEYR